MSTENFEKFLTFTDTQDFGEFSDVIKDVRGLVKLELSRRANAGRPTLKAESQEILAQRLKWRESSANYYERKKSR